MKQHTAWGFSATYSDIDLERILAEAPAESRVVEVVIGPKPRQRVMFIRTSAVEMADNAGMHLDTRSFGTISRRFCVTPLREFHPTPDGSVMSDWRVANCSQAMASLEDVLAQLEAVDAHYAQKISVAVRAG